MLRNVPVPDLSLQINIGEIENTYQSSDFTGDTWQVQFTLTPNQTHDITVRWFAAEHLLLEEYGQFETTSENATITPELEYISAGFARFDSDCDGFSNLDEIINETNLAIAQGSNTTACTDNPEPLALADTQAPVVIRQHAKFVDDGFSEAVVSYEQQIQIREHYKQTLVSFTAELTAEPNTQTSGQPLTTTAAIRFQRDTDGIKWMRFSMNNVTNTTPSTFPGAQCDEQPFFGFLSCGIPLDWQENRWYTVSFEQISTTQWRARIIDAQTQSQFIIGTVESQPDIRWTQAANRITDFRAASALDCQQAQPASTMRYRLGKVNGFRTISSFMGLPQVCAQAGLGWSEGVRTVGFGVEAQLEYELTLGRSNIFTE